MPCEVRGGSECLGCAGQTFVVPAAILYGHGGTAAGFG